MPEHLNTAIRAALARLPLRPEISDADLEQYTRLIEYIIGTKSIHQKQSTPKQALKELWSALQALQRLEQAERNLSSLAWSAIYSAEKETGSIPDFSKLATSLAGEGYFVRGKFQEDLHILEQAIEHLSTLARAPSRGRKINWHARTLAIGLAATYSKLTGDRPTRRTDYETGKYYGPFVEFVEVCFKLAGLDAAPHEYARFAANNFEGSKGVNPPD